MIANMELYKIFYQVAKAGSISKAAKELYISQPAVSQSIKQLEERLGGHVFVRSPKGVTLTREGEVLFKHFEQAYTLMRTAENKFWEMLNLMSGEIRIGASDTISKYYLLPKLEQFHSAYPELRIQVTNRTTPETLMLLRKGDVDLAVVNLPISTDTQYNICEALEVQDCFVAGVNDWHICDTPLSLEQLAHYPLLLLEKGSNTRHFIDNYMATHGIVLQPEIELGSIDLLVQFAMIGLGIAYVVKDFIGDELQNGQLREVPLLQPIPSRTIGIVTLRNVPLATSAKKFIDLLIEA